MKKISNKLSLISISIFSFLFILFVSLFSNVNVKAMENRDVRYFIVESYATYEDGSTEKYFNYFFSENMYDYESGNFQISYDGYFSRVQLNIYAKNKLDSTISMERKTGYIQSYGLYETTWGNTNVSFTDKELIGRFDYNDKFSYGDATVYSLKNLVKGVNDNINYQSFIESYKELYDDTAIFDNLELFIEVEFCLVWNDEDTTTYSGTHISAINQANNIQDYIKVDGLVDYEIIVIHDSFSDSYDKSYQEGFADGADSVDITTDNNEAINDYISNNNLKTESEYNQYGDLKYQEGFDDGEASVDITIDNQEYADKYIFDNGYYSNDEYIAYGEQKYQEGYEEGENSVDITTDNNEAINDYISNNNLKTESEYFAYGEEKYSDGYSEGVKSVDVDSFVQAGYEQGFEMGVKSVDITTDNQEYADSYIKENKYHTDEEYISYGDEKYNLGYTEGYDTGYSEGYEAGVGSIDVELIKTQEYNRGYVDGEASVDITIDNIIAINNYIIENNLKSEDEFLAYGERKYQEGISSVDRNAIITEYISEHKLYDEESYLRYGLTKYNEGINSVDITADNDYIIQQYIAEHDMKTRAEYDSYGEWKYQEGIKSVDITSNDEEVINDFIKSHNYYSNEEYIEYGKNQYFLGYTAGADSINTQSYWDLGYAEGYVKGFDDGEASIDITEDNALAIENYLKQNKYHNDDEFLAYGESKYSEGYEAGVNSVYNNIEDDNIVKEYVTRYIQTNKYYTSTQYIDNYNKGYNDGYTIGYENGITLSNVDEIKKQEYQRGYNDGYNIGFSEGEYSVDITSDNDTAIDIYITENHYHPHWEFELNFDLGWEAGTYYVYNNLDFDVEIQKYVRNYIEKNNYYTKTEYDDNYQLGYDKGYSQGYDDGYDLGNKNVDNVITDEILVETMREKLGKGLTIQLIKKDTPITLLLKDYNFNVSKNGDTKITIHYGEDKTIKEIETVVEVIPDEKENNDTASEDMSKIENILAIIFVAVCGIGLIVIVIFIFNVLTKASKKSKKKNNYLRRKK